ncbi:MAG: GNAT family N-acetyltransferase [Chitinophagaceae bacterium]
MNLTCKLLDFNSDEHLQSIEIRRQILRLPIGLNFTKEELENEVDQFHFAVFDGKDMLGVLLLKQAVNGSFEILKMRQVAVLESYQGKGAGQYMVQFAEQWASSVNCRLIELHARNTAVNFYLKMAYELIGDEFQEVGIPHFKMLKYLRSN